eukprot:COSAG04_NODE_766_length_10499_cov_3.592115_8_plen_103_part_00
MWPIDGRRYEAGEVLQLEGGIQSYLAHKAATATATESGLAGAESGSSWRGHCFVFDERTAVGGTGAAISPDEAARLAESLGPRAGKSLRRRLADAKASAAAG